MDALTSAKPDLADYVAFFEIEPEWVHASGWYYGARFSCWSGDDQVVATIAPDEGEFALTWSQQGRNKLSLSLKMVVHWEIERRARDEYLLLHVNTGPQALCTVEYCLIRLRPLVEVDWRMNWGPGWSPSSSLKGDNSLLGEQ